MSVEFATTPAELRADVEYFERLAKDGDPQLLGYAEVARSREKHAAPDAARMARLKERLRALGIVVADDVSGAPLITG